MFYKKLFLDFDNGSKNSHKLTRLLIVIKTIIEMCYVLCRTYKDAARAQTPLARVGAATTGGGEGSVPRTERQSVTAPRLGNNCCVLLATSIFVYTVSELSCTSDSLQSNIIMWSSALLNFILFSFLGANFALEYSEGTYRGITVAVDAQVPKDNCQAVLNNLEVSQEIFLL